MIGDFGLNFEILLAVSPDVVAAIITFASKSSAASLVALAMEFVMLISCSSFVLSTMIL